MCLHVSIAELKRSGFHPISLAQLKVIVNLNNFLLKPKVIKKNVIEFVLSSLQGEDLFTVEVSESYNRT